MIFILLIIFEMSLLIVFVDKTKKGFFRLKSCFFFTHFMLLMAPLI